MVLAARDRVLRRTQQRTRLTKTSRRKGPRDQAVWAPCIKANGMLVISEPTIMAGSDQFGFPSWSRGRRGAPVMCSTLQSHAVQRDGRRNPRKPISSKNGASVTPNANRTHAAPGDLKSWSIGAFVGP